jgi:hypothetical protein
MPDLKTEMAKVLDEWNKPETTMTNQTTRTVPHSAFAPSNNVCRATFESIRTNPGKTRQEHATLLETAGYKRSSTTSLIGQMVKQNLVRDTGGVLSTITSEYRPIKSSKAFAKMQEAAQPKKVVTLKRREPEEAPAPQINSAWDAEVMLNNLSIKQARALYDELRKIFGG